MTNNPDGLSDARGVCLTPGCKYVTEIKTSYAHSSYGNARLSVTVLLPDWKSLKAASRPETTHIESVLHRHMEQAVAEIGQYDLALGGDVAKDWPKPTPPASTSTAIAAGGAELIEGVKRVLQNPDGEHDGWTDAGLRHTFFRWPTIVRAINAALTAAPKAASEDQADRDRRMYEQGRRDERAGEPEAFI